MDKFGGGKLVMKRVSISLSVAVVGLCWISGAAMAADYVTHRIEGPPQNCGVGGGTWKLDFNGTVLQGKSDTGADFRVDTKTLKPDGSGRVATKDDKGRDRYFDFEPGTGHRPFRTSNGFNACQFTFTPKK
jgi:hypothetical protein